MRIEPKYPCPHCGKEMRPGQLVRHERLCIANPERFEFYKRLLAGAAVGEGITHFEYCELVTMYKNLPEPINLPDPATLRRAFKVGLWVEVLACFGYAPPTVKPARVTCELCGAVFSKPNYARHIKICGRGIVEDMLEEDAKLTADWARHFDYVWIGDDEPTGRKPPRITVTEREIRVMLR